MSLNVTRRSRFTAAPPDSMPELVQHIFELSWRCKTWLVSAAVEAILEVLVVDLAKCCKALCDLDMLKRTHRLLCEGNLNCGMRCSNQTHNSTHIGYSCRSCMAKVQLTFSFSIGDIDSDEARLYRRLTGGESLCEIRLFQYPAKCHPNASTLTYSYPSKT